MASVVVDAATNELRRALGPTSWVVSEDLLVHVIGTAGAGRGEPA